MSEQVVIPDNTESSVIANISVSPGEHSVVKSAASLFPYFFNRPVIEIRIRQYSIRTEQAYAGWGGRFLMYHKFTSDAVIQVNHIVPFLEHLVVERNVAVRTQRPQRMKCAT